MIDFSQIERYRENNCLEVKAAQGGLPRSIWETYAAFANSLGGVILLGVGEREDHSLVLLGLENPERLIKEFWDTINNPAKVNINLLSDSDVYILEQNGKRIIVILVPRADRSYRPVYIGGNPVSGTFRRDGEGDYRCTKEEYQALVRDAAPQTQDMKILEDMDLAVINHESLRSYRQRMRLSRPGHVWESLADEDFLLRIGAGAIGKDGKRHPTAAGLLMFGNEYDIVREFNHYFLDYREQYDTSTRWTDRIISSSGDWSGNVYDFYFRVYHKLVQDIKVPFALEGTHRVEDTSIHQGVREALANCIVHADYYGRQGLVVLKTQNRICFSNPGSFRIEILAAKIGGISDPRNATLLKMFNLIDIGERAGSGIPNLCALWEKQGWGNPTIEESFEPDRVTVTLQLQLTGNDNTEGSSDKSVKSSDNAEGSSDKHYGYQSPSSEQKNMILNYLAKNKSAKTSDISALLGVKDARARRLLAQLVNEKLVLAEGGNRNRRYRLSVEG